MYSYFLTVFILDAKLEKKIGNIQDSVVAPMEKVKKEKVYAYCSWNVLDLSKIKISVGPDNFLRLASKIIAVRN